MRTVDAIKPMRDIANNNLSMPGGSKAVGGILSER
jgi:hypothetical protein